MQDVNPYREPASVPTNDAKRERFKALGNWLATHMMQDARAFYAMPAEKRVQANALAERYRDEYLQLARELKIPSAPCDNSWMTSAFGIGAMR